MEPSTTEAHDAGGIPVISTPPRSEAVAEPLEFEDPKRLYRIVERILDRSPERGDPRLRLASHVREVFETFGDELRIRGAAIYDEHQGRFHLGARIGDLATGCAPGFAGTTELVRLLEHHPVLIYPSPDAQGSPHTAGVMPALPCAVVLVREPRAQHILFFVLADTRRYAALDFTLNTLRSVLSARMLENRWGSALSAASEIQRSILPLTAPDLDGFEILGRSRPAEEVGGDFYDFLDVEPQLVAIAIGDASGHGLPAALVARDVHMGLRMGVAWSLKMTRLIARLNELMHGASQASSFVSLFYGELDETGHLHYVNAGHPAGLHLKQDGRVESLAEGGSVLGPLPDARFRRHATRIEPGEVVVLVTDGILERRSDDGAFFEAAGLATVLRDAAGASASEILTAVIEATRAHGQGRSFEDDATVVVVRRLPLESRGDTR